jgi:hypothetical protein
MNHEFMYHIIQDIKKVEYAYQELPNKEYIWKNANQKQVW